MPFPRITVVTPSYNQGRFLDQTIQSVLGQQYPNLEYIIIDGASHDESVSIIRQYEQHLTFWVSEPDRGQSHAINKGWQRATGDIVAYLNSDDLYRAGALAAVAESFSQHPEVGMVYGNSDIVDEQGRLLKRHQLQAISLADLLAWHPPLAQPAVFWRKDVLTAVGILREDLYYMMDYEFFLRVATRFPIRHLALVLAVMRSHPTAKTSAQPVKRIEEALRVAEEFFTQAHAPAVTALKAPTMAALYLRQADVYCLTGQPQHARACARHALELCRNPFTLRRAAWVYFKSFLPLSLARLLRRLKHQAQPFWHIR